jgi:hypothetical protein
MINHKQNTEYEGKIKEAMKERQNSLEYKRQDTIESLTVEVASLGIFDNLEVNDIKRIIIKIVENNPIDTDLNILKTDSIQQAITLNQKKKVKKEPRIQKGELLPLLTLRSKATRNKQHTYELLKEKGFIKNPLQEFYK